MKLFAFALLALALTAGCSDSDSGFDIECNVSCKDGFTTKLDGSCKDTDRQATIDALSKVHGGCTGPLINIF
jgi:hypothetical protein